MSERRRLVITGIIQTTLLATLVLFAFQFARTNYVRLILLVSAPVDAVVGVYFLTEHARRNKIRTEKVTGEK